MTEEIKQQLENLTEKQLKSILDAINSLASD